MHIFLYEGQGGIDHNESSFSRIGATISNGEAVIKRQIFFESDAIDEDAADIMALPYFPQKYSAHPRHPAYKYYGNCKISPVSNKSKKWVAELDYSSNNANATDSDGNKVTADTPPWKLRPDNFSFEVTEETVPFVASYNNSGELYFSQGDRKGEPVLPVCNSAGDLFQAEKIARNRVLSFTYSCKNWNFEDYLRYCGSTNNAVIKVAGIEIAEKTGLIRNLRPEFITVYEDGTDNIKWQYWQVSVEIVIDKDRSTIFRRFLDIGNRAKFNSVSLAGDELLQNANISTALPANNRPSQICYFRLAKNIGTAENPLFAATGDPVFCSWEQYLLAVQLYRRASQILMRRNSPLLTEEYQLECEQLEQMPLDNGYLYYAAIEGSALHQENSSYKTRVFREYPALDWSPLNLPIKGVK